MQWVSILFSKTDSKQFCSSIRRLISNRSTTKFRAKTNSNWSRTCRSIHSRPNQVIRSSSSPLLVKWLPIKVKMQESTLKSTIKGEKRASVVALHNSQCPNSNHRKLWLFHQATELVLRQDWVSLPGSPAWWHARQARIILEVTGVR